MGLGQWIVCITGNVCINGDFRSSVYIKVECMCQGGTLEEENL